MKLHSTSLAILLAAVVSSPALAQDKPDPQQALALLQQGNSRFIAGESEHPNLSIERVLDTGVNGQQPFATILGCSDSRVPVELVLDQGVGDLFIIRVAGNVAAGDELGSIEYGVAHLKTPLLVVLGHSHCGACTAVVQGAELHGNIPGLVAPIEDAVREVRSHDHQISEEAFIEEVVEQNVWESIADVFASSSASAELVRSGELMVVGAIYDIETGEVRWLGEHADQDSLLAAADSGAMSDSAAHE